MGEKGRYADGQPRRKRGTLFFDPLFPGSGSGPKEMKKIF